MTPRRVGAFVVVLVVTTLLTAVFIFSIVNAVVQGGSRAWVWSASLLPLLTFSWVMLVLGLKRGSAHRAREDDHISR